MNKDEILAQIQALQEMLVTKEAPPPKKKRGRPKKVEQKKVEVVEDDNNDEENDEEYDMNIEIFEEETPVKKTKKTRKDPLLEEFRINHKKPASLNEGKSISWQKPKNIEFFDDLKEYTADIEIDKKLKVQERVPRTRPAVKKVKISCMMCNKRFTTYSNNINYYVDPDTNKNEPVPMRCNNCYGR